MGCETCSQEAQQIPYIAHESAMARSERSIKRLVVALIMAVLLIFASNAIWLYAWMQYDYTSEESSVVVDGEDGVANYLCGIGDINNGV